MSDWETVKVGDVFEVQLGKMLNKKAKEGKQFSYLNNFNVQWGTFDFSKMNEMHFNEKEKEKYRLKKGDILMCEGGEVGRCAIWQENGSQYFYQKALHRLRTLQADKVNPDFFCAYMAYLCSGNALTKIVGETSIAHLTREKLLDLNFPCPPKSQQDEIASVLQTWDTAIEKTEALIAAKEKQFKWLLKKLISDQKNNPEWREVRLGEMLVYEQPTKYIVSSTDYTERGLVAVLTANKSFILGYTEEQRGIFHALPVIIFDDFTTATKYVNFPFKVKSSAIKILILAHENVDLKFVYHSMQFIDFPLGGHQRYWISKFQHLKIKLPAFSEQRKIISKLDIAESEIELLKRLAEQYRVQKRGLMQKLLTGVWKVSS